MSLELEEKLTGARIVKQIWRLEIDNIVLSFFYRMWFSNFVISTSMIIIRESLRIVYGYRVIATSNSPSSNACENQVTRIKGRESDQGSG